MEQKRLYECVRTTGLKAEEEQPDPIFFRESNSPTKIR